MRCDYSVKRDTLVLQWHITSRCNLRCKHCYQENYDNSEMEYETFLNVVEQYKELLQKLNRKGHINITGGEPFIHKGFFDFLEVLSKNNSHFSFGILTNGTLVNENNAGQLKDLQPAFVQISIEGDEKTHNSIRGEGNLKKVTEAIKHLKRNGIKTLVSFTAHKENYKSFPYVAKLCEKNGVFKLWTDRMVPFGGAERIRESFLSPQEMMEFFNIANKCKKQRKWRRSRTIIELKRALQFLADDSYPYTCKAGESLICLLEDGTVLPCRRLPITAGNIIDSSLTEIYSGKVFESLRAPVQPPQGCDKCSYFILCKGGAKCISYAVTGDYTARDPGCPIVW